LKARATVRALTTTIDNPSAAWRRVDFALLGLVMLIALGTRCLTTINRPFQRDPEGCGAFYGTLARNYFRYGMTRTFAVPIQNIGVNREEPVFYPNHPPLLPLLVAGTYAVCGWNPTSGDVPPDWQTRLSTTLATLACTATIFVIRAPFARAQRRDDEDRRVGGGVRQRRGAPRVSAGG